MELALLREEWERWPGWALSPSPSSVSSMMGDREEREWTQADCVIAGSQFVAMGLLECGVPTTKIRIVPYGVDPFRFHEPRNTNGRAAGNALRVLFAGQVGLRKGIPYLLAALQRFQPRQVEARIAGAISLDAGMLRNACGDAVQFHGAVPRSRMRDLFEWADVFVLPTIVEGSATVVYEALMSGIPVITTPNAGSLVRHGVDGFIVPIRDVDALTDALRRYHEDRSLLAQHRIATHQCREIIEIRRYREDLKRVVVELGSSRTAASL